MHQFKSSYAAGVAAAVLLALFMASPSAMPIAGPDCVLIRRKCHNSFSMCRPECLRERRSDSRVKPMTSMATTLTKSFPEPCINHVAPKSEPVAATEPNHINSFVPFPSFALVEPSHIPDADESTSIQDLVVAPSPSAAAIIRSPFTDAATPSPSTVAVAPSPSPALVSPSSSPSAVVPKPLSEVVSPSPTPRHNHT
eukprot:IDg4878t1